MFSIASKLRLAAVVLAAAGALAPTATARPTSLGPAQTPELYVNPSTGQASPMPAADPKVYVQPRELAPAEERALGDAVAATAGVTATSPSAPVADDGQPQGFDWPSAAIGAATIGGLLLLVLAATFVVGRRGRGPLAPRSAAGA